jgi:hypothetical protein
MRRMIFPVPVGASLVVAVAAIMLGLAVRGLAATPPDQVPFTFTMAGLTDSFPIPSSPPVLSWKDAASGQTPLLGGSFTYVDHAMIHLGVDGNPISCTDGVGAFTAINGDSITVSFSGLVHPSAKAGLLESVGAYIVTCGKGRFAGAAGSGTLTMEIDPAKNLVNISWNGTISAPK